MWGSRNGMPGVSGWVEAGWRGREKEANFGWVKVQQYRRHRGVTVPKGGGKVATDSIQGRVELRGSELAFWKCQSRTGDDEGEGKGI